MHPKNGNQLKNTIKKIKKNVKISHNITILTLTWLFQLKVQHVKDGA
jgi:hypothetical protein